MRIEQLTKSLRANFSLWAKGSILFILTFIFIIWVPYIKTEVLELPNNFSYSADLVSYDDLFDEASQQYSGQTQSNSSFKYETVKTDGSVGIIKNTFDVRDTEGKEIFSVQRLYGIDHETRQHVSGYGDKNRQGYLFGPPDADKSDFTYWQANYDQPLTMKFQDEEQILGLTTYRYRAVFKADQTQNLTSLPGVGKTVGINLDGDLDIWIEPLTGDLVKYQDSAMAYYYDLNNGQRLKPWNRFSNQFSFDSVVSHVEQAKRDRQSTLLSTVTIPSILVLLVAGLAGWLSADIARRLRIAASGYFMGSVVFVLALATNELVANLIGLESLVHLFGTTAGVHWFTALSFIVLSLCAVIIALARRSRGAFMTVTIVLALLVIISVLNIVGGITGWGLVIKNSNTAVSPATSLSVVMASLSLLIIMWRFRKLQFLVVPLLSVILVIAGVTAIGSAYDISFYRSTPWIRAMSVPTAIMATMISVSILNIGRYNPARKKRPVLVVLIFVVTMVLATGVVWRGAQKNVEDAGSLQFESDVNRMDNLIYRRMDGYINALSGARSLFFASDQVSRSGWKAYVDGLRLNEKYPGNLGIGYAVVVPASQVKAVEQQVRNEGFRDFTINPIDPPRDTYTTILYLEPFNGRNQKAFGYDMFSEEIRREAMTRARDQDTPAMSGKVTLLQETSQDVQAGFVIYVPLYRKGSVNFSAQQRENIQGYVYSPVRMGDFMRASIGGQTRGMGIKIYDAPSIDSANKENLMYASENKKINKPRFEIIQQLELGGHTWTVQYYSLPGYVASVSESFPTYVLAAGISISVLLGVAVYGLASSRQRALMLAQRITKDLKSERNKAVHLQERDEAVLQNIGEGLLLFGADGKIERANEAAQQMLGFDEGELVGGNYKDVLLDFDEQGRKVGYKERPVTLAFRGQSTKNGTLKYRRKNGKEFYAELSVEPIMSGKSVVGVVEVFRDITERKALAQAKDDFISLASHQLRTPLTANKWFLEMLISGKPAGKLSPKQTELAKKINVSNEHLIELVISLLNVTRVESGRLAISPQMTDFNVLLDGVVDSVQERAKAKHQKIVVKTQPNNKLIMDENLIRQVITNLLTNAIKYSPDKATIAVDAGQNAGIFTCTVSDQGYGIPAGQHARVFEKFFRADNILQKEPNGNGLGLYLVKEIIEVSGGKIWFESQEGKGTTFHFTLPVEGVKSKKGEVALEGDDKA